jgi:hypothetical protein
MMPMRPANTWRAARLAAVMYQRGTLEREAALDQHLSHRKIIGIRFFAELSTAMDLMGSVHRVVVSKTLRSMPI